MKDEESGKEVEGRDSREKDGIGVKNKWTGVGV